MEILQEIQYQLMMLSRWVRELKFKIMGVNRSFYCQAEIEGRPQCKHQCNHCRKYYQPLEDNWKPINKKHNEK